MIIDRANYQVEHTRFDHLGEYVRPGDLLVFNTSRTLPAALDGCELPAGPCMEIRLAQHLPDDSWLALLLCQRGNLSPVVFGAVCRLTLVRDRDSTTTIRIFLDSGSSASKSGTELIDLLYRLGRPN